MWTLTGTLLVTLALLHSQEVKSQEAESRCRPNNNTENGFPRDCTEIRDNNCKAKSGDYFIHPCGTEAFRVYCDMDTDGGGWTVFQRREDGSLNFTRLWSEYKVGFGNVNGEHWLGNDNIYRLSSSGQYEFRVDMSTFENERTYAPYDYFRIGDEKSKYKLILGNYTGNTTPGDSFINHRNMNFSTIDSDNDIKKPSSCAVEYKGGWWYQICYYANLNGCYFSRDNMENHMGTGIMWVTWKKTQSLKTIVMKIRRLKNI